MQIDVAGVRRDHWIDLGECKCGSIKSLHTVVDAFESKISRYPTPKGYSIGKHIFLRNPSKQQVPNMQLHHFENMFNE